MTEANERRPILVTGARGFTGAALAIELVQRGHQVRGMVRKGSDVGALTSAGIEVVEGDVRDREDVMRAVEGTRIVYHIAAVFRTAGHLDQYYHEVNVGGVANVIEAARAFDVERTVHCSTIGVHGDVQEMPCRESSPFNPGDVYQRTKLEGEQLANEAFSNGLPGVVFRPASIYGPGDLRLLKLFKAIHTRRFRMIGSGEVTFHMIYIDDLVDGIIRCGERPAALGRTYILAGPDYIPLNEMVARIAESVGTPLRAGKIPVWPVMTAALLCEAVCRPLGVEPPLHRRRVGFFTKNRAFTSERAEREIGFNPTVDSAEGIRRTAAWYFQNGYLAS